MFITGPLDVLHQIPAPYSHREAVETLRQAPPCMLAHAIKTLAKDLKQRRENSAAA